MRFILKSAFWLGLLAFLIPFGGEQKETSANVTAIGLFLGAQQAVADITGFCDRAPMACETGRELGVFAAERIGDGIEMAYGLVEGRIADRPADEPAAGTAQAGAETVARAPQPTDPIATGTIGRDLAPARPPAAYIAPKRSAASSEAPTASAMRHAPSAAAPDTLPALAAVPTPAPRS